MKMMKYLTIVFFVFVLASCSQKNKSAESNGNAEKPKTETAKMTFASDKDLVCGMSITSEAKDTAMVDGKVYGFCSKTCKEKFVRDPKAYLKD